MYLYGLIGNALSSALVSDQGSIDWLCLPRPDSPPVFGRLLDPHGGSFSIKASGAFTSRQAYLPNTNVLETHFTLADGSEFRLLDFCPRFAQYGRMYRPLAVYRIVEPLKGQPFIKVSVQPVSGWEKTPMPMSRGNSHLRFDRGADYLRLATNMSLSYLTEETSFGLREPLYFALTWNAAVEEDLGSVSRRFLQLTEQYWRNWVRHCDVPHRFQAETIRSALVLKLHCYEDTGAILAALTTSLPEQPGAGRNWDYRYCWLRDAYFSLKAFHKLGHFEEMQGFLNYLLDIAHRDQGSLHPVYRLDQTLPLPELEHPWAGWRESRPVRSGNQAAEHVQNDVYGEMALTLTPLFLDERFADLRHPDHEKLMGELLKRCSSSIGQADAGLWELRSGWKPHAFTHLMLWAGLDRGLALKRAGLLSGLNLDLDAARARAASSLQEMAIEGSIRSSLGDPSSDASLLLAPVLRFPDEKLCAFTVDRIRKDLSMGRGPEGFLYRYRREDDFGKPESAFVICSFWLVQALAKLGRLEQARLIMAQAVRALSPLGLLPEHFDPDKKLSLGNFPQAYSHVGLIHAAFAVSESWDDVL